MSDLDSLLSTYKGTRLKYMNVRRDAEEALLVAIVERIHVLEATRATNTQPGIYAPEFEAMKRKPGRPPKEATDAA